MSLPRLLGRSSVLATAIATAVLQHSLTAQVPDTFQYTLNSTTTNQLNNVRQGHSVAVEGQYTVVGCPNDHMHETDAGSVKVYDSATGNLLFLIPNPKRSQGRADGFGSSVAISGQRIVVGAPGEDTGGTDVGSAYVYDLQSASPTAPVATFRNPEPDGPQHDYFGNAVGISGTRVVVGCYSDNYGAANSGSVYVYDLASATPETAITTIHNPSPGGDDNFGYSVAIAGTKVAIGAPEDDSVHIGAGAVYIYDVAGATPQVELTPAATVLNPTSAGSTPWPFNAIPERFGWAVALSSTRLVIGSPQDIIQVGNTWDVIGRAYAYDIVTGTPANETQLDYPGAGGSNFGIAVATSGNRVVVGAPRETVGDTQYTGAAYVFEIGGGSDRLGNPVTVAFDDSFGHAVAVDGTKVVVGAPQDNTGSDNAGSAYLYDMAGATPTTPTAELNHGSPAGGAGYGAALAMNQSLLVVGSPQDDTGAPDSGRVFVYDRNSANPTVPVAVLDNPTPAASDLFGASVAVWGTRVVVGAYGDDTAAPDAGAVYVYDIAGATPTAPVATFTKPNAAAGDVFGYSVATNGGLVLVGAYGDDTDGPNSGRAFVFNLNGATPTVPIATIVNPDPAPNDVFGAAVGLSGMLAVIGSHGDDNSGPDTGRAYLFNLGTILENGETTLIKTLNHPEPFGGSWFGLAVAVSNGRVIVGAPWQENVGKAYYFQVQDDLTVDPAVVIPNPNASYDDQFGTSVAINSSVVAVGAPRDDSPNSNNAGFAYAFRLNGANAPTVVASYAPPTPFPDDYYGSAVAVGGIAGQLVAVGMSGDNTNATDQGSVRVFAPAPPAAPSVITSLATDLTVNGATLRGIVDANRATTRVTFTYAPVNPLPNESPITVVASQEFVAGDEDVDVSAVITGLRPHTEYTCAISGVNSAGADIGEESTFTTENTEPVAQNDDAGMVAAGSTSNISVLGNDTDADGDSLTIIEVTALGTGSVSIAGDVILYTPTVTSGSDSFTYTVSDGFGGTATATVTLSIDGSLPTLSLGNLKLKITAGDVSFSGVANDAGGVSRVEIRLNGGAPLVVTPANATNQFDWMLTTVPEQGVNTVEVTAFDAAGNPSESITKTFTFTNLRPELAGNYVGLLTPEAAALTPWSQHGLATVSVTPTGGFTGKVSLYGTQVSISGVFTTEGAAEFGKHRTETVALEKKARPASVPLGELSLAIDTNGGNKITGQLRVGSLVLANVTLHQAVYTKSKSPIAPFRHVPADIVDDTKEKGRYTAVFEARTAPNNGLDIPAYPQGHGYGLLTVSKAGVASMQGKLADGSPYTFSAPLSKNNEWPVFIPLYSKAGFISGEVKFDSSVTDSDASAAMTWFKPDALPKQKMYPAGWQAGIGVDFAASKYIVPTKPSPRVPTPLNPGTALGPEVLPVLTTESPNIVVVATHGGVPMPTPNDGHLAVNGKMVVTPAPFTGLTGFSGSFVAPTGAMKASFVHPLTNKVVKVEGVAYQKTNAAAGFYHFFPPASALNPLGYGDSGGLTITKK